MMSLRLDECYCSTQNLIRLCIPRYTKSDTTLRHELLINSMWLRVVYDFTYCGIQNLIRLCVPWYAVLSKYEPHSKATSYNEY